MTTAPNGSTDAHRAAVADCQALARLFDAADRQLADLQHKLHQLGHGGNTGAP